MPKKLLIDAAHKEETRVALIDEKSRLIEYDIETTNKQTIKGNVYLAKVMRVEPSLQAAFVDYGGNRHGFLAFSEIHPDYFRIPVSDREALAAKLADAIVEIEEPDDEPEEKDTEVIDVLEDNTDRDFEPAVSTIAGESVDHSDEDPGEDARRRRPPLHKMYKIQEVIHKNQILLIQVTKEERGQKGAALTTYLSLAGRYCVLMPNSPQAGGISRKIANPKERKSLRETLASLDLPKEMGLIIRTAGQGHTKAEIKRDTDYLTRQWSEIRDLTLQSIAPALIYQEDSIIKRVIRDQYSKEISEILITGDECYKSSKAFMKKLLPSHAKNVQQYKDRKVPLFIQYKVEHQIEKMHDSTVMLPSGGSIVINPTEALVSIDINSGRATRERHIEETALNTNLEAAAEIARQVRLRDLAGLVVIDFIDMDDRKHVHQVERKVRESFKNDRARVQMGKISPFGLLELSRQRLRPSMLETSSQPCPHCHTTGHVRSTESMALLILRSLDEEGITNRSLKIKALVPTNVAFYILNEKRDHLADIEMRHEMHIVIEGDHALIAPNFKMMQIERKNKSSDNDNDIIEGEEIPQEKDQEKKQSNSRRRDNRSRNRPETTEKKTDSQRDTEKTTADDEKKTDGNAQKRRSQNRRRGNRPSQNKPESDGETKAKPITGDSDVKIAEKPKGDEEPRRNSRRRSAPRRRPQAQKSGTETKPQEISTVQKALERKSDKVVDKKSDKSEDKKTVEKKLPNRPSPNKVEADGNKIPPKKPDIDGNTVISDEKKKATHPRKSWLKKLLE